MANEVCYIVRGAKMKCSKGSSLVRINLPKSHGTYVNGKPVMIKTDRIVGENIGCFGLCGGVVPCAATILGDWIEYKEDVIVKEHEPITTKSVLVCALGGTIKFVTDGQYD